MSAANTPRRSFFARALDSLVEARMQAAEREIRRVLRSFPEAERRNLEKHLDL